MLYSFLTLPQWLHDLMVEKAVGYADILHTPYRYDYRGGGQLVNICTIEDVTRLLDISALQKKLGLNDGDLDKLMVELKEIYGKDGTDIRTPNSVLFSLITRQAGLKSINEGELRQRYPHPLAIRMNVVGDVLVLFAEKSDENHYLSMGEVVLRTLEDILSTIDKHTDLDTMISSDFYEAYCDSVSLHI